MGKTCSSGSNADGGFSFRVEGHHAGQRLDRFLSCLLPDYSRTGLSRAVSSGLIRVDGEVRKNSCKLRAGQVVEGLVPVSEVMDVVPRKLELDIIFEDEHLLVICKAPGVVTHPGAGHTDATLANGIVYYCRDIIGVGDDALRPGIVHRLDKDTSGVLVVAKTQRSHRTLSAAFKERKVVKRYHALVHGIMKEPKGKLTAAIGRHPVHRKKMMVRGGTGSRYAVTNWQVKEEFSSLFSLVELLIETGRTHQIRVHLAHLGHPVAGDIVYGSPKKSIASRQLLHASFIGFPHPETGENMTFHAPLWPDFQQVIDKLRQEHQGCR